MESSRKIKIKKSTVKFNKLKKKILPMHIHTKNGQILRVLKILQ